VNYDIDTCPGNSGSPVYDGPSGAPTARAVHARGYAAADPVCGTGPRTSSCFGAPIAGHLAYAVAFDHGHGGTGDNCGPGFDSGVQAAYTKWIQDHAVGVGGITELLMGGPDSPASASGGSGPSVPYAAIVGGVAAAVLAVAAAGGWYARRLFRRRRV
jgi:hypothetical protein